MKPSAIRIERMLEKIEARLVPPPRKVLGVIIDDRDDEAEVKEKKEKALAEHVACHPEDVGRTVEDFNWMVREIVRRPRFIVGADGRVRWLEPIEGGETIDGEFEDTDGQKPSETPETIEGEFEDTDKDTDGPSETLEPIDLPPPDPGCLARSKPWRPVHQRPARDQRGLERSRRANWKHGHFSREAKAERSRLRAAILALRDLCDSI